MDKSMETLRQYRNKTVCVGCTERTLVVSIFPYSFVCWSCVVQGHCSTDDVYEQFILKYCKMGDLSDFQKGWIVGARLAGASVNKMSTLLGVSNAAVSKAMTTYTNHRKTSSAKRNSGQTPKLNERGRHTLEDCVQKS